MYLALPDGYYPLPPGVLTGTLPRRRSDAKIDLAALWSPGLPVTLRGKARRLGVSHEAVRQAMVAAGIATDLETRNAAIKDMAERGVPWLTIAKTFGLSASGVRFVCRDLPRRPPGRKHRGHQ